MPYTLEEFKRDYIKEGLQELTVEERLEGVPPKKRLEGLSLEERLEGVPPNEIESLLQKLMGERKTASRKPRRKK